MILRTNRGALVLVALLGFAVGLAVSLRVGLQRSEAINLFGGTEKPAAPTPTTPAPTVALPDFAALAQQISPSVVNISSTQEVRAPGLRGPGGPGGPGAPGAPGAPGGPGGGGPDDPFHEFFEPFERFFGPPRRGPFRAKSLGSGFVIDASGYIITNNHVVENADEIMVRLSTGKEFKAKVIGRDSKTDIALVQISGAGDLTPVVLGNSDDLKVGQWVVAIGNPFGLENTVTAGIVSAMARHINQGPYDDFIQTDAAINPGNSGGPLLNTRGEVVGINTAIFSRSGGNIGIGFAIPIGLAKEIVPQLKEKGHVTRGWLGVMIQKVTPDIAETLGLPEAKGALVADVVKEGPAEVAGLKQGDVIVEYDGKVVGDSAELPLLVARTPVGKTVKVKVIRDKAATHFDITIAELKEEEVAQASSGSVERLGLTVQTLTPDLAENLGLDRALKGVVVTQVDPDGPGAEAGLRRGDVIIEVNRQPVKDADAYRKTLKDAGDGKSVLFLVRRGDNTIFLAVKPSG
jgi:serine protease Do